VYGSNIGNRWPKEGGYAQVPYDFDESIRTKESAIRGIEIAIGEYHKYTCIRFKRRTTEKVYLLFVSDSGCASSIGMVKKEGPQKLWLGSGCWHRGTVIHEIGHSMGLWHEQNRPDRDQYIKIHHENVQAAAKHNFRKATQQQVDSLGTPYDYRSIMHYRETAFGSGSLTIETLDPYYQHIIGKNSRLSQTDVKQLNLMYNCPAYAGDYPRRQQSDTCYDENNHCTGLVARVGCKDSYARKRCKFTCNACGTSQQGTDPLPTFPAVTIPARWTPPTTKDPNPNCPYKDVWANCKSVESYCNRGGSWGERMKKNCRKTCNFCGPNSQVPTMKPNTKAPVTDRQASEKPTTDKPVTKQPATGNPSCRDTISNCAGMKQFCTNASWVHIMRQRCRRTCNMC